MLVDVIWKELYYVKMGLFFRLDSDHDMIGMVEFELEKVIDDLIELVHIDTENNVKTIIRLF